MSSYLSRPYPSVIEDGYSKSIIINITVSVVVFFILFVFKPTLFFKDSISFSISDSLIFTGITFAVSFFYTNIITRLFPKPFDHSSWTVGKEILFLFCILLSISIVNFFVGRIVFYPNEPVSLYTLFQVIIATFIVGVIPMIVVVSFYLYFNQKKIAEQASTINESISPKPSETKVESYTLRGTGKYETIDLNSDEILFIESVGNYCDIYYLKEGKTAKRTFRATLLSLSNDLPKTKLLKTHRSFLVNLNMVKQVSGNAQGYQLSIKNYEERLVPVSRSNISIFNEYYQ